MRRSTLQTLFLLAMMFLVTAQSVQAQGGRGRHRHHLDAAQREAREQFVSEVVGELKRSVGDKLEKSKLSRFESMARSVVRGLKEEEFQALKAQPIAERVHAVPRIWQAGRDKAAERFIKRQPPAVAAELRALDAKARDKRIAELKILATLEHAITAAEKHGLLQQGEADRLRAVPSKEQLKHSSRLNREVFFAIHGAEISAEEKERLKKLSSRKFWRDRTVRRYQVLRHIDAKELKNLRKLDRKSLMALGKAVRSGKGLDAFVTSGALSEKTARSWSGLGRDDRNRLMRDLMRVHLPRMSRGIRLSREQMSKLSRDEQRQVFMMNDQERLAFLKEKFPNENWDKREEERRTRAGIEEELKQMDRRERSLLRSVMPSVAARKLTAAFPNDTAKVAALLKRMRSVNWFRSVIPSARMLRMKLTPEERATLKSMTVEEAVDFYFKKFGEQLDKEATLALKKSGIEVPAGWQSWSGSAKVTFLNAKNLRMPWPEFDRSRRWGGERRGRGRGMRRGSSGRRDGQSGPGGSRHGAPPKPGEDGGARKLPR